MSEREVRAASSAVERLLDTQEVRGSTPRRPTITPNNIPESFWDRVEVGAIEDCWLWTGAKSGRYRYGRYRGKRAHRLAYETLHGPIPCGMLVRHSCDNPPCCNPWHLILGTNKDNTGDAIERNRLARGEKHGKTKLTPEIVAYIRENPLGLAGCDLAVLYGVHEATISYIRSGRSWKKDKTK
jgi:HNH endonuclease